MSREYKKVLLPKISNVTRQAKRILWPYPANDNKIPLHVWLRWVAVCSIILGVGAFLYLFA